jgi:hypothetical protein
VLWRDGQTLEKGIFALFSHAFVRADPLQVRTASLVWHRHANSAPSADITTTTTMVLPVVASAARRHVGLMAKQQAQRRTMGSAPAVEWEGIDKVVRGYFPEDYQRAYKLFL